MGIYCFQIHKIPDLSLNKYQSVADTGVEGVLKRQGNFLRQWHGICIESDVSIHLLYAYLPFESVGHRLKLYFMLQGDDSELQILEPLLKNSTLSDFYTFTDCRLPEVQFEAGATFIKKERVTEIFNPLTGKDISVHYVPGWIMNEEARLYDLFRMLETVSQSYSPLCPCAFRIDLYPVSLVQETRATLNPILKALRGENDIKLIRDMNSLKEDNHARDICSECEEWLTNIETSPHFRINIYGFAESIFKAKTILMAAGSEAINKGDFTIAPIKPDSEGKYNLKSRMGQKADDYCFFSNVGLKTWSTTYCLLEAMPFFRFPVLFEGENIEIPKETAPAHMKDGIYLGQDMNSYPVYFPLKDMSRHAFFTGMPGSGKTNTMLHIVSQLRHNNIPFLIMEPAKKEYRSLFANRDMEDVFLFSPHLQSKFPLLINPLEFPKGVMLSEHINALLEVFEGVFILEGPTYKFLSSSIQRSYTNLGWDIEDINDEQCQLPFPSLQDVYDNLQAEIETSSYNSEFKGNVRAFLQVRLGGLMERDAGEMFNTNFSTLAPEEWIDSSAIVELESLGEQAKNFFVLLICHYILETLRIDPNGGRDLKGNQMPVRHVIFIEEAHNIIAPSSHQFSTESVDPKVSATAYIVKMLAEVRALREAIVIADQLPTALANEVTKNTGLKLVHRLIAKDDREVIGSAVSASELQMESMASFSSGKALIYHEHTQKPFEIQIEKWIMEDEPFDYANDIQLYKKISDSPAVQRSIMSALQNWQDKNLFTFENQLRALQEDWMKLDATDTVKKCLCNSKKIRLTAEGKNLKKKCEKLEKLWAHDIDMAEDSSILKEFIKIKKYIENMIFQLKEIQMI